MMLAFDARFLLHGFVHPHSRLVHLFLRQNGLTPFPARIILYTDRAPDPLAATQTYAASNVEIKVVGPFGGRWQRLIWLWFTLPRALKREGVTLFYSSFYFLPPRVVGVRLINSIHDCCVFYIDPKLNRGLLSSPVYLWVLKRMMQWTNRRADATVTVSNFSKAMLHRHLDRPLPTVRVCYHGFEQAVSRRRETIAAPVVATESRPYFLFVGSNLPKKNIRQCIAGYARLPVEIRRRYQLRLKTDCYPENRAQIDSLGLGADVEFIHDHLDDEAMAALYQGASLLLLLSYDEGFGLPIIEAFAANVPVLVANRAACDELVTFAASKVDPNDTDAIARKWHALVTDQPLRESCLAEQNRLLPQFQQRAAAEKFHAAITL